MRREVKKELKQRFYGYIFEMKEHPNKLAQRLADDFELMVIEKDKYIHELEHRSKK